MAKQAHCKHQGCTCVVPKDRAAAGKDTCSDFCAAHEHESTTKRTAKAGCGCGHPGCSVQPGAHM